MHEHPARVHAAAIRWLRGSATERWRLPAVLAILAATKVAALLVFTAGFLLTRVELPNRSSCTDFHFERSGATTTAASNGGSVGCWVDTPIDKVVLLIIDGARFDFAVPSRDVDAVSKRSQKKAPLHSVVELLEESGGAAELFRFVADPPTTTQQRLKGLLTGGLPTFMDVSNSFGATELAEDNLMAQAATAGRRVALSGDDTWLELFHRAQFAAGVDPFPSFNVRDLDTVDQGVRRHLMPALGRPSEWDMLVGHFLGVDHAGHTFGVDSPAMARKLDENNADIRTVTAVMASEEGFNRSLLIVMGDHGMTKHGDHGGGTPEETDTFIFVHHPRAAAAVGAGRARNDGGELSRRKATEFGIMPQVDFAPTLALILGLPIPFGSLGTVPRRFWEVAHAWESLDGSGNTGGARKGGMDIDDRYARALKVAAAQVWRYLQEYAQVAGNPFTTADWSLLTVMYATATSADLASSGTADLFARFLSKAAEVARVHWVQFGPGRMTLGLALLIATLVLHVAALWVCCHKQSPLISIAKHKPKDNSTGYDNCMAVVFVDDDYDNNTHNRAQVLEAAVAMVLTALGSVCRLSNSFILAEGDAAHFFIASLAVLLVVRSASFTGRGSGGGDGATTVAASAAVGLLMCNAVLQALGMSWAKESFEDDSSYGKRGVGEWTTSDLSEPGALPAVLVLGALAALPWVCHRTITPVMGLGSRVTVAAAMAAVGVRALATGSGAYALGRAAGQGTAEVLRAAAGGLLPWATYWASSVAATVMTPASAVRMSKVRSAVVAAAHGTVWAVMPVLVMLSGERGAVWGLLAVTQVACLVLAVTGHLGKDAIGGGVWREVTLTCAWHILALQLFYASGHRCAFDGLHFACAFTGFTKFHFYLMGTLLAINTWSGDVATCAYLSAVAAACSHCSARRRGGCGGQFTVAFRASLTRLALGYSLLRAIGVVVSTVFAAAARRHLMVWAVFAPKFVFEACGMCVSEALLALGVMSGLSACNAADKPVKGGQMSKDPVRMIEGLNQEQQELNQFGPKGRALL